MYNYITADTSFFLSDPNHMEVVIPYTYMSVCGVRTYEWLLCMGVLDQGRLVAR